MQTKVRVQRPVRVNLVERKPFTDHLMYTRASKALGLVTRLLRHYNDGSGCLLDVNVGTGLVLTLTPLTRSEALSLLNSPTFSHLPRR